jgi:hypothetical protein
MNTTDDEEPDSPLERAHALLVAAINNQAPGTEARYLARLGLLLLNELGYSDSALKLIQLAHDPRNADTREPPDVDAALSDSK